MSRDILSGSSDDSLALRILDIVRRRAMLAACVFAVVLAAAVSLALYLPDLYRATTLVVVERPISEAAVQNAPGRGTGEPALRHQAGDPQPGSS